MPLSIGVNLRVTGHCNQGGRKYMEDMFSVAFHPTPDEKDLEYAFFGIFDGHGGGEAATFAKEHLMDIIVKQKSFWSDRDEDVLRAIKDGYLRTHYAMWRELDKWPRTPSGLPSTAGTTASIAFIRKGKIYIGHVGDSGIILGYHVDGDPQWRAKALTKDHKPESGPEMTRIQESGGKVVSKSGVPRVVWNRPRIGHKGPVRRSTHIDEIPFLAVARSLGDLWSYNSELDEFVVSPRPDVKVVAIDVKAHRCLIFGTDGLWNMLTPQAAVAIVQAADRHNEKHLIASQQTMNGQADIQMWINPSKSLVDRALERWSSTRLRADNTSVVTLMLDPPRPSSSEVLLSQKERVVMHHSIHGTHAPSTTVLPEMLEKVESETVNLSVPRPPAVVDLNAVDTKLPDSSGEVDEAKDEVLKPETVVKTEENVNAGNQTEEDTKENGDPEHPVGEGIQVAEISSSEILEEIIEINTMKETETVVVHTEKPTKTISEEQHEGANTKIVVEEFTEPQGIPEINEDNEDNLMCSNMVRQNAFTDECEELKSSCGLAGDFKENGGVVASSGKELKSNILSHPCLNQHTLFPAPRSDIRDANKRHTSVTTRTSTLTASGSSETTTYVSLKSRFKSRTTKVSASGNTTEERIRSTTTKTNIIGSKRRHSAISQTVVNIIEETITVQEPCAKRRTRSEDRPTPTDENDPANQATEDPNSRLSWPNTDSSLPRPVGTIVPVQERLSSPNTFQRRSLGKKATPVKAIRRSSINSSTRLQQLRGSFGLRDWEEGRRSNGCNERKINRATVAILTPSESTIIPQRWLRSDTMAATPVRTLRSRNVDITGHTISAQLVHQYGVVKQNRLSLPSKLKQPANNGSLQSARIRSSPMSNGKLKQAGTVSGGNVGNCSSINTSGTGSSSSSGIAKRVKSPYNPSARSLSTRSRIKRLGK